MILGFENLTCDLEKDICCVHIRVPVLWESVYLGSCCMAIQGLRNTVKADKVNLRFDIAGLPVWNCILCVG